MRSAITSVLLLIVAAAGCGDPDPAGAPDAATTPDAAGPAPRSLVDWVAGSGFVFRGRVIELEAATEPAPPDFADPQHLWQQDRLIIVEPVEVSLEPVELQLIPGSRHTMILRAPARELVVGQELYFFGGLFSAGQTLVMTEVGRLEGDLPFERVHQAVHATERYLLDRALTDRLLAANRVIYATVTAIDDASGPITDEGPDWWTATLMPRRTLRGPVEIDPIQVHFDASRNFCCYEWPKLQVGDQAIYLLQPDTITGLPDSAYVLDSALDEEALIEEPRIRSLIASPPVPPVL